MAGTSSTLADALHDRYTIERELGRGGMAIVFLARDRRHDRLVALKTLRPELLPALGPERFLREIQIAAGLQHPNILPLHDSGETEGLLYYVMPYVEGESLRARLEREGQLPLEDALQIAREVAEALAYAHGHGVVHRDIKPENILLSGGHALVADFGIARAITVAGGERLTETGLAIGTAAYMSPEQAAADPRVDGRSDIYSLGCVLYEMVVGDPPFTGPSAQAVIARKLTDPVPPPRTVREIVPEALERVILKTLAKLPVDRFRTADAFAAALSAPALPSSEPKATARPWRRHAVRAVAGSFAAIAVAVAVLVVARSIRAPAPAATSRQLTFSGDAMISSLSPDGQFLAYGVQAGDSANIVVQDLSGGSPDTVAATPTVNTLEWSPDGTRLLVGTLNGAMVLPRLGGSARTVPWSGQGWKVHAYWLPDGSSVSLHTNSSRRILVVHLGAGDTVSVPVSGAYTWLYEGSWSPDGHTFAVATGSTGAVAGAIRITCLDGRTEVITADSLPLGSPRWSGNGDALFYTRGIDAIWRLAISRRTGRPRGKPEQMHQQREMLLGETRRPHFGLTRDGRRMTYARGTQFSNLWMLEPGASGSPSLRSELTRGTSLRWGPAVSPDGRWIGFAEESRGASELFRMPLEGGVASQVTFDGWVLRRPSQIAWSPDGGQLAFVSMRAGPAQVWTVSVKGGQLRPLEGTRASISRGQLTWAPGARIAYQTADHRNIIMVDPRSGDTRSLLGDTAGFLFSPQHSPDGDRLAVVWNRSSSDFGNWVFDLQNRSSVKLRSPPLALLGWSPDGRNIYAQGSGRLYRVDTRGSRQEQPIMALPWRDADCTPAGPLRPKGFVCAAFDFVADVWMIENFESGNP